MSLYLLPEVLLLAPAALHLQGSFRLCIYLADSKVLLASFSKYL